MRVFPFLLAGFVLASQPPWLCAEDAPRPSEGPQVRIEFDWRVKMRDGVELSADVYRPEGKDRSPVILSRTPYNKAAGGKDALEWNTSQVFKKGHRIRIEIASSAFPKFDRNLNTGEPLGKNVKMQTAEQKVYHDRKRPSFVLLPIVPSKR